MAEARRAHRHIVLKAGTITFGGNVVHCLVRNLSTSGAALEVSGQTRIPGRFVLQVPADGLHLPCRALWRNQYRIGVAFG
jgi:PilZ domain